MNIFVGNLPFSAEGADLETLFAPYGKVSSAQVLSDRDTGRSRGFGFVEMPDDAEAQAAIEALSGRDFGGRTLQINEARPRTERSENGSRQGRYDAPRSGGGGGYGGNRRSY